MSPFPPASSQMTFSRVSRMELADTPLLPDPAPPEASNCPPWPRHATPHIHPSVSGGVSDPCFPTTLPYTPEANPR